MQSDGEANKESPGLLDRIRGYMHDLAKALPARAPMKTIPWRHGTRIPG